MTFVEAGQNDPVETARALSRCFEQLETVGLLLLQDAELPSITGFVAGGPIRGSWWGNPAARGTYEVMRTLEDHPDVLVAKLVSGKVTYIHRFLWPAFLTAACERAPWQMDGLSPSAVWLLERVDGDGAVQTDDVPLPVGLTRKLCNEAAREIERRLLAHGYDVHTPSGVHAKVLEGWSVWSGRVAPEEPLTNLAEARSLLEAAAGQLGAAAHLPWLK